MTLEELIADDSFIHWLNEEASTEEKEFWDNWVDEDPEHQMLVREARELTNLIHSDDVDAPNPFDELQQLEQKIDQYEADQDKSRLNHINYSRRQYLTWGRGIAAGFILLILSLGILYSLKWNQSAKDVAQVKQVPVSKVYNTDYGEKLSLTLSDGSQIILNANSSLKYLSSVKEEAHMDVWLKGEAYFNIRHFKGEKRRVFTVHTGDGFIKDIGTKFSVNTFGKGTQAVLQDGRIQVQIAGIKASDKTPFDMNPGQLVRFYTGDSDLHIKEVDPVSYTSWTGNNWIFNNTPVTEVAKRIEHTFGVKVQFTDRKIKKIHLSGSIKSTNLKILKEALAKILGTTVWQKNQILYVGKRDLNR